MKEIITALEPRLVWKNFYALNQIPRCSKHEEQIRSFVIDFAKAQGLKWQTDEVGNVLVSKPATSGMESRPAVVIQGHLDMVCEKNNDTVHDFSKDPIKMKIEDGWVTAEGTTLGADNGIAVAIGMALMETDVVAHPPLEFLFTVDEETGLTGASALKSDFVQGRILLNIDSEEEGALYIGCAGGLNTLLRKKINWQKPEPAAKTFLLKVGGLHGGHSGLNINDGLGNAIVLNARVLFELAQKVNFALASFDAGSKHNAIPREADSLIVVAEKDVARVKQIVETLDHILKNELHFSDKDVFISLAEKPAVGHVFEAKYTTRLINMLYAMPNGVMGMSRAIEGLVETSTNLAIIKTGEEEVEVLSSQRSSVASEVDDVAGKVKAVGQLAGFEVEFEGGYPAWEPNPDSKLLATCKKIYEAKYGSEPEVKAIHAGLECGIIGEHYEGMDMISFGPDIFGAHSPDEKIRITSVQHIWEYLQEILKNIQ